MLIFLEVTVGLTADFMRASGTLHAHFLLSFLGILTSPD